MLSYLDGTKIVETQPVRHEWLSYCYIKVFCSEWSKIWSTQVLLYLQIEILSLASAFMFNKSYFGSNLVKTVHHCYSAYWILCDIYTCKIDHSKRDWPMILVIKILTTPFEIYTLVVYKSMKKIPNSSRRRRPLFSAATAAKFTSCAEIIRTCASFKKCKFQEIL